MFKVIVSDVECFGRFGYFTTRSVAFGKSPKQAWANLRKRGAHTVSGGHPEGYGGVPVLQMRRVEKDGEMLSEIWDWRKSFACKGLGPAGPPPGAVSPYVATTYDYSCLF